MQKQSDLSIPYTVEATLWRAKGHFLTKRSAKAPHDESSMVFKVYYPGERLPDENANFENMNKKLDLSQTPVWVSIRRPDMSITLSRSESTMPKTGRPVTSYAITATHSDEMYRVVASSNNFMADCGNPSALSAVQNDPEFAQYVSFIKCSEQPNKVASEIKPWNLEIFEYPKTM